ncbi:MAG: hypothetical protein WCF25_08825 [Acidimicrobiales bacterium]
MAAVAAFLLGPECDVIAGSDFLMDGGVTAVRIVSGVGEGHTQSQRR